MCPDNEECKCEFLFAVLAEKHNAIIRRIREIRVLKPPQRFSTL